MNPREIEVHIEELILHGFDPKERWRIGDALESELRGLLSERGLPAAWGTSAERLPAGPIAASSLTKSAKTGEQIAGAIYKGGEAV